MHVDPVFDAAEQVDLVAELVDDLRAGKIPRAAVSYVASDAVSTLSDVACACQQVEAELRRHTARQADWKFSTTRRPRAVRRR